MALVEDILNYYSLWSLHDIHHGIHQSVQDCMNYLEQRGQGVELRTFLGIVRKFENDGFLLRMEQKEGGLIYGTTYVAQTLQQDYLEYGSYSFYYYGFPSIRNYFSQSVLPIDVTKTDGSKDIGTCFVIGGNKLLTARHCVDELTNIKIYDPQRQLAEPTTIWVSGDDSDMAIIELNNYNFSSLPAIRIDLGDILNEVLTMGYPPIPGFDAIQVADTSHIGSSIKVSSGRIIAENRTLWDHESYYLINAKVKGGNSGGPIINNLGFAIGMITDIPLDSKDQEKIDHLAYGVAITGRRIKSFMSDVISKESSIQKIPFKIDSQGFSTQH